VKVEAVTK